MSPGVWEGVMGLLAGAMACSTLLILIGLVVPSLRSALVARLRGSGQETAVGVLLAEVRALRGEVYALRCAMAPVPPAAERNVSGAGVS